MTAGTRTRRAIWTNGHHWNSPNRLGGHHYARLLVEHDWELAFVSDPISPLHLLKPETWKETRDRFDTWQAGGAFDLHDRLFYYTPMTLWPHYNLPGLRSRFVLENWRRWTLPDVVRHLRSVGFAQPDLLGMDSVIQGFWLDVLRPTKSIVRIADLLSGFEGVSRAMLDKQKQMIREADHVIYTARPLAEELEAIGPRSMTFLPNGAECRHFMQENLPQPAEYENIPEPRALYVGAIEPWFDVPMMLAAARELPDVSFVVIGPQRIDLSSLAAQPNVHILGRRPYSQVPQYMQHAQVGLIPFVVDPMIDAVHPIKLYEYCAAGLPVVAVSWKELRLMRSPAVLVEGHGQFVEAIRASLSNPPSRQALRDYALRNDWEARFNQLMQLAGFDQPQLQA